MAIKMQVDSLIYEYFETDDAAIFAIRDKLLDIFRTNAILQCQVHDVQQIAINSNNRYGDGIEPEHVHNLTDGFLAGGASVEELKKPLATEMPPEGHPMHDVAQKFVLKIVRNAQGSLPEFAGDCAIKVLSATKTHSLQALRLTAMEHTHEETADNKKFMLNGALNMSQVKKHRPEMWNLIKSGVTLEVLVWPAEEIWPRVIEILQEVDNLGQQAASGETRWQVCLKMHRTAVTLGKDALSADKVWERVVRNAKRGNPSFKAEIDDLAVFTRRMAGVDGHVLEKIVDFNKQIPHPKIIKGSALKGIAEALLGPDGVGNDDFRLDPKPMHACIKNELQI